MKLKELFNNYFVILIAAFFYALFVIHAENSIFNDWVASDPLDRFPIIHLDLGQRIQSSSTPITEVSDWFWSEKEKSDHVTNLKITNLVLFLFSCLIFSSLRRKGYESHWEYDLIFIFNPLFVWLMVQSSSHGFFLGLWMALTYEFLNSKKTRTPWFTLLSLLPGLCSSQFILFPLISYFAEDQNKLINKKFIFSLLLSCLLLVWSIFQNQNQVYYYGQELLAESFIESDVSMLYKFGYGLMTAFKAFVPLALRFDYFSVGALDLVSIILSAGLIFIAIRKSKDNLKWLSIILIFIFFNFLIQNQIIKENLLVLSNAVFVFWRPVNNLFLATIFLVILILPFDLTKLSKKYSLSFAGFISFLFLIAFATNSNSGQALSSSLRQNPKSEMELIALKQFLFEKDNAQDLIIFQKELSMWSKISEKKFITTVFSKIYEPDNEFRKEIITEILEQAKELNYSLHPYMYADLLSVSGRFDLRSKFYERLKQDKRIAPEIQNYLINLLEMQYKNRVADWLSKAGRLAGYGKNYEECLFFITISQGMMSEDKQKLDQELLKNCKDGLLKKGKK